MGLDNVGCFRLGVGFCCFGFGRLHYNVGICLVCGRFVFLLVAFVGCYGMADYAVGGLTIVIVLLGLWCFDWCLTDWWVVCGACCDVGVGIG